MNTNLAEIIRQANPSMSESALLAAVQAAEATMAQESEAAELEGLKPMPDDLVTLRSEKLMLDEQVAQLNARLSEIKDTFASRIEAEGLQGFTLNGKVKARVSHGTRNNLDTKKLKDDMPHVWAKYLKPVSYTSVRVS